MSPKELTLQDIEIGLGILKRGVTNWRLGFFKKTHYKLESAGVTNKKSLSKICWGFYKRHQWRDCFTL